MNKNKRGLLEPARNDKKFTVTFVSSVIIIRHIPDYCCLDDAQKFRLDQVGVFPMVVMQAVFFVRASHWMMEPEACLAETPIEIVRVVWLLLSVLGRRKI